MPTNTSPTHPTRRRFLQTSLAGFTVGAGFFVHPTPAASSTSSLERLNIAAVGATGRAGANVKALSSQNIIGISDIDAKLLEQGASPYPAARKYRDFRAMLEKESDKIDAVVVGTPDHTHAPSVAMALRLGKHVYCEKPLTHTVFESRKLAELARKNNLVTQMGTQIHALENYRQVVEMVQSDMIGAIRQVHVWADTVYTGAKFTTNTPAPKHVNWDLWLGPAPQRPYSEGVHPFTWRAFWDYGNGTLGDFGCHYMDLAHWALNLRAPSRVRSEGPPVDPVSAPAWLIAHYEYPARGEMPPVKLTWYDSGRRPKLLSTLRDQDGKPFDWGGGQLFVGETGMILSNYTQHRLIRDGKVIDFKRPEPTIPRSIGHHNEWVQAIKTKGETTCNFDYSGALTESVLLGVASYRSSQPLEWDAKNLKVKNSTRAQDFIHHEYRKGWTL